MIFNLFRRTPWDRTIASLYGTIVAQARARAFYQIYGVPDTVNGRFEMVVLHAVLLLHRLRAEPALREPLGQGIFDMFCNDMDATLREMGVGDLAVPRSMRRIGEAFYGRQAVVEAALAAEPALATPNQEPARGRAWSQRVGTASEPAAGAMKGLRPTCGRRYATSPRKTRRARPRRASFSVPGSGFGRDRIAVDPGIVTQAMAETLETTRLGACGFRFTMFRRPGGGTSLSPTNKRAPRSPGSRRCALCRASKPPDVTRRGRDGLHVLGRVSATVGQNCVVTLDPIENEVEDSIDVVFAPATSSPVDKDPVQVAIMDVAIDDEDPPEPLVGGAIDLGAIATEFLILAIDPHRASLERFSSLRRPAPTKATRLRRSRRSRKRRPAMTADRLSSLSHLWPVPPPARYACLRSPPTEDRVSSARGAAKVVHAR